MGPPRRRGALPWLVAVLALTSAALPGLSYLLTWPLLAALLVLLDLPRAPGGGAPWPLAVALALGARRRCCWWRRSPTSSSAC